MFQLEGEVTVHKPQLISEEKNTPRKVLNRISTSSSELTPSDAENSPTEPVSEPAQQGAKGTPWRLSGAWAA